MQRAVEGAEAGRRAVQPRFQVERLGVVMQPEAKNPDERLGTLNPAALRGPDGRLYLYPRIVAERNYSRIGRARVRFDAAGKPVGVDRLGYVLEPQADYERNQRTGGGCEDPRTTYIPAIRRYVMTYVALGDSGPRLAVAVSDDAVTWRRLGLLQFSGARVNFNAYGNKDASFFPEPVSDPDGKPALAIIHRPTYRQHFPDGSERVVLPPDIDDARESIWISYVNLRRVMQDESSLAHVHENHRLLAPKAPWEQVKVGGGAPPVAFSPGWLLIYHGICPEPPSHASPRAHGIYCAGAAILDRERPWHVRYRSPMPILAPERTLEQHGVVDDVVFPTGIDPRPEAGTGVFDLYYGMADYRIGAARLRVRWGDEALRR